MFFGRNFIKMLQCKSNKKASQNWEASYINNNDHQAGVMLILLLSVVFHRLQFLLFSLPVLPSVQDCPVSVA
jgi:hypothetical protein